MKARPLMKTSVLRSCRVNLFKNQVHSIERPRRMFTHYFTLLRSNHEVHKQHSMLSDWPPAEFQVKKRSRFLFPSYFLTVIATAITAGRCVGCIKWCIAQWKFQMLLRWFYLQYSNKSRFRQRIEVLRRARCSAPGKINRTYLAFDVYHM